MGEIEKKIASHLLESKAIILEPSNPFTWASGWRSPIYCDNRVTLSFPEIRSYIKEAFRSTILKYFNAPDLIAGVATGAIAQGALVADIMGLPFVYVRPSAKEHGRQNLIEGRIQSRQKVVVIEDLISTGGSSLKAVEALKEAGTEVLGMVAIFSYGFELAAKNFSKAGVELHSLCSYQVLIETALASGEIQQNEVEMLNEWRKDPVTWQGK